MFQMWQFCQATTLTQRCKENVNTDQSIKVAKGVYTGFLRVHRWAGMSLPSDLNKQASGASCQLNYSGIKWRTF